PVLEFGAGFEDLVFEVSQFGNQNLRQSAGSRAEFEHGFAWLEDLRNLARERAAEQWRELRRGDEIAARTELARAGRVVAQARLMQRELHVAGEADPVARGRELGGDAIEERAAGCERLRPGRRQLRGLGSGAHVDEFTLEFRTPMEQDLQGRTALVTGAARRIGAAIARR